MYAIIEDSGKQFKVTGGDVIRIDRPLDQDLPTSITFDRVLLVGGEGAPKVGTPVVSGAIVTAEVLRRVKAKKVLNVKYKRRKGFHKTIGHRQKYVEVKIGDIRA